MSAKSKPATPSAPTESQAASNAMWGGRFASGPDAVM
jgi:hypothetical protein